MAEGAVALVTGGARRIGAAIAADLAKHGFSVAVHARLINEAKAIAAEIEDSGGRAVAFAADLAEPDAANALAAEVAASMGPVRLLINNASSFEDDSIGDYTRENWARHFAVHLEAPVALSRAMAAGLPRDADGLIVNMVDQRVERLNPRFFSYTLSKSALWTATRTMAQALAPAIRVNAIGPGPTLKNARQKPEDFARQVDGLLLKRGPDLAEFGATIRWLWSARSVTGQLIQLDGGQHLAWETPDIAGIVE